MEEKKKQEKERKEKRKEERKEKEERERKNKKGISEGAITLHVVEKKLVRLSLVPRFCSQRHESETRLDFRATKSDVLPPLLTQ